MNRPAVNGPPEGAAPGRTASLEHPSRLSRRVLMLVCYLGYAGMLASWGLLDRPWGWALAVPLGLSAATAGGLLLAPALLGVSEGTDADLDERQIRIRNRAYLWAYRVLGGLVTLAALYYMIATDSGGWLPRSFGEAQAFFWGVWLLAFTLPAAILAWTEPDEPPDDSMCARSGRVSGRSAG